MVSEAISSADATEISSVSASVVAGDASAGGALSAPLLLLPPRRLRRVRVLVFSSPCVYRSLKSTSSISAISAFVAQAPAQLNDAGVPTGTISHLLSYLAESTCDDTLSCKYEKTTRRDWVESVFDLVIRGSTYCRSALALATVVVIRLLIISDEAMFDSIALRCVDVRPR